MSISKYFSLQLIVFSFCFFLNSNAQQINWGYKFTQGHKYFYRYVFDQTDEQIMDNGSPRHDCFIHTTDATIQIEDVHPKGNISLLVSITSEKHDTIHFTPFKNVVVIRPFNPAKLKILISKYGELISGIILEESLQNKNLKKKYSLKDTVNNATDDEFFSKAYIDDFVFCYPKVEKISIGKSWLDTLYGNDKVNSITIKSNSKIKQNDLDYFSIRSITSYKIDSIIDSGTEKILKLIRNKNKVANDMHMSEWLGDEAFYIRLSDGVVIKSESTTHSYNAGIKGNTIFKTSLTLLKEE